MTGTTRQRARKFLSDLRPPGPSLLLVVPVGVLTGTAGAFFLWSLDAATSARFDHLWLLYLLPLAGLFIASVYHRHAGASARGTNLIIDEIHEPGGGVPARITPLVLGATLVTHLFGGSAGREGTAVQMGGGLAAAFATVFRVAARHRAMLLMAGVAAGFGAVFGTPFAGAVFALEVLTVGRLRYDMLVPCLVASLTGDLVCTAWGAHHAHWTIAELTPDGILGVTSLLALAKAALAGAAFGLCARLFSTTVHGAQHALERAVRPYWLRPVVGGVAVIALVHLLGTREYLGLGAWSPHAGDVTLLTMFQAGGADTWSWFWKLLFTVVTLGSGFKGGEVTPLFFIGGALGNVLAGPLGLPPDLAAGLGLVAVFAGASKTPLACTIMGVELFGAQHAAHLALACWTSYYLSGSPGIYSAQRRRRKEG